MIADNEAHGYGGGISISGSPAGSYLAHNEFIQNHAGIGGGGMYTGFANPVILGNVFRGNSAILDGGALKTYVQREITDNEFTNNSAGRNGGGIYGYNIYRGINGNTFVSNTAGENGGGCWLYIWGSGEFSNNLVAGNQAGNGAGLFVEDSSFSVRNCTIADNSSTLDGGGMCCTFDSEVELSNSIVAFNTASRNGANLYVGDNLTPSSLTVQYSDVVGAHATVFIGGGDCQLILGDGVFDQDPLFVSGPEDDYYLSQMVAGQPGDSPCVDAGTASVAANCYTHHSEISVCLDDFYTRNDGVPDSDTVDLGYHRFDSSNTVLAGLVCTPSSGTLPFLSQFNVELHNAYTGQTRRVQYQVDVTLAGGQYFPCWRRGWQNVQAGMGHSQSWGQNIPALGSLTGENGFLLTVADVTPAPYNQPPYPPAGDMDTAVCTVTGY